MNHEDNESSNSRRGQSGVAHRNHVEPEPRVSAYSPDDSIGERATFVGRTGQTSDGRSSQSSDQHALIARASYWEGNVPSPEDMAAFKKVEPTFPERIMRMTEQTVDTQNRALKTTTTLEAWATAITAIGYTVLPWVLAGVLAFTGHDVTASIAALAGLAETGPKIIDAIKEHSDKSNKDE